MKQKKKKIEISKKKIYFFIIFIKCMIKIQKKKRNLINFTTNIFTVNKNKIFQIDFINKIKVNNREYKIL